MPFGRRLAPTPPWQVTKLFKTKGAVKCAASADTICYANLTMLALRCSATKAASAAPAAAAPQLAVRRRCAARNGDAGGPACAAGARRAAEGSEELPGCLALQ
jgi:hypothetical protein